MRYRVASIRRLADHGPWQHSTPSVSPSCSRHFWCWPASCRVSLRCGSALPCCLSFSWSACCPGSPGHPRNRLRHERSVRDLSHRRAGRNGARGESALAHGAERTRRPGGRRRGGRPPRRPGDRGALNRLALPQGLHAPLVMTGALVVFGVAQAAHASGFLAVYLAGLIIGNRPTRAHSGVVACLAAGTWLAPIVMVVLLGLLAWPSRLIEHVLPRPSVAA